MFKKAKRIVYISRGGVHIMKRSLNFDKIVNKLTTPISSEEALKDVIPFNWSQEVLEGTKKITVCGTNK